jgi:hypothetical protein
MSTVVAAMSRLDVRSAFGKSRHRTDAGDAELEATPPPRRRFPRLGAMLVLAGLVLVLNVMHVRDYTFLSLFDETHHIDYLIRGARGQVVLQPADQLTQEALSDAACHGSQIVPFPECGRRHYEADDFVWRGLNAASSHSPYYYVVTGQLARALRVLPTSPDSLVTWGRLLGSAWLLLGCYLTLRAGDLLGLDRTLVVLALVTMVTTPVLLHASTTVNPDAAAFMGGALALFSCLAWERGSSLWLLGAAAFVCAALDPTNSIGLVLVLLYMAVRAAVAYARPGHSGAAGAARVGTEDSPSGRSWMSYLSAGLVVLASAVAAVLSWNIAYVFVADNLHLLDLNPNHQQFVVDSLQVEWLVGREAIFDHFPPLQSVIPEVLDTEPRAVFVSALQLLLVGSLFAVLMRSFARDPFSSLGIATFVTLLVAAPVLVVYNLIFEGVYYRIPTRMTLSALPAVGLVLAGACSGRVGRVLLVICAVGLYLSAVVPLAEAFSLS